MKKYYPALSLLFLILSLISGIFLVKTTNDLRNRAAGEQYPAGCCSNSELGEFRSCSQYGPNQTCSIDNGACGPGGKSCNDQGSSGDQYPDGCCYNDQLGNYRQCLSGQVCDIPNGSCGSGGKSCNDQGGGFHKACVSGQCVNVAGQGSDECTAHDQCTSPSIATTECKIVYSLASRCFTVTNCAGKDIQAFSKNYTGSQPEYNQGACGTTENPEARTQVPDNSSHTYCAEAPAGKCRQIDHHFGGLGPNNETVGAGGVCECNPPSVSPPTNTPVPSNTPISTPTNTPVPSHTPTGTQSPSNTPQPTNTAAPESTPTPTSTNTTPRPTSTPLPSGPTPTRITLPNAGVDFPAKGLAIVGTIVTLLGFLVLF